MISHLVDGVLLLALLFTSWRVGAVYRELRRLRGYQAQYVEVFDETSRAASDIGAAIRHLDKEGRAILLRLEASIEKGRELARRLEAANRPTAESAVDQSLADPIGTYTRRNAAPPELSRRDAEAARFKNEILKFGSDTRRLQERRDDVSGDFASAPQPQPHREFRLAPSVNTIRAAGGKG